MMRSSRLGAIPSELGDLIDELNGIQDRLHKLEAPSGEALSGAVERLRSLAKPTSFYQLESPATFSTGASPAAVASVAVPDGYTRAIVNATASATLRSDTTAGAWALLTVAARITPSGGASFYNQWASVGGQQYGGATAAAATTLDDLEPGSTITVEALVSFPAAYTLPRACVAGSILFLR